MIPPPILTSSVTASSQSLAELLGLGAPPDLCDEYGVTPLVRSARNGHVGTTGLLLVAGSDVNIIIKVHFQPLRGINLWQH